MPMDKQAIVEIEELAIGAANNIPTNMLDHPVVLAPSGMTLLDLEPYLYQPLRHRGHYQTNRIASFLNYVNGHHEPRTHVFVSEEEMEAEAIFDHYGVTDNGDPAPGWRDHRASLVMKKTPEWAALTKHARHANHEFDQREFLDFITDWAHALTFKNGDDEDVPMSHVYQAVQKLEVKKTATDTHEEQDYRASRGRLEELDVRGASQQLPATMHMACATHIGLEPTVAECRLMVLAREDSVAIGYRINALDKIMDASVQDFVSKVRDGLTDIPLWVGEFYGNGNARRA